MKKHCFLYTAIALLAITLGCKKEFDSPPVRTLPEGSVLSVAQLRALYVDKTHKIAGDSSVYAVVTADERSGNLYRNVFIEDTSGAINVRLKNAGGLYEGDSIRIYLKGCIVSKYNGMIQLDSVSVDDNVVKQGVGKSRAPRVVTMAELGPDLQSKLIKLENVEFSDADAGRPFADAVNQSTQNRTLTDCNGNSVIVRTSGYASFANQPTPQGKGSLIAVVSQFNNDLQLYIRTPAELDMRGTRCSGINPGEGVATVQESFDNAQHRVNYTRAGWKNVTSVGSLLWTGWVDGAEKFAAASAFEGTTNISPAPLSTWLITPPVIAGTTKKLSFKSAVDFKKTGHNPLTVWISTTWDGVSVPQQTDWQQVQATVANSASTAKSWISSGDISLAGHLPQGYEGNFYIAFRYDGNRNGLTTNLYVDDVYIRD